LTVDLSVFAHDAAVHRFLMAALRFMPSG